MLHLGLAGGLTPPAPPKREEIEPEKRVGEWVGHEQIAPFSG